MMMRMRHSLIALTLSLLLGLSLGQAQAATAEATAEIDWSTFTFSTSGSLVLSFGDVGDFAVVIANTDFDQATLPSAIGAAASAADASSAATATTDGSPLPGGGVTGTLTADAEVSTPSALALDNATAIAFRDLLVIADSGTGRATFTVDYTLSAGVAANAGDFAQGWAQVGMGILDFAGFPPAIEYTDSVQEALFMLPTGLDTASVVGGTLEFSIRMDGGDAFILGVSAYADARNNVPVPPAVYLLGSSLVGLIGLRRRRV